MAANHRRASAPAKVNKESGLASARKSGIEKPLKWRYRESENL
jgi:hypothetical protein